MAMLWLELSLIKGSIIQLKETSTWCLMKESKEPPDPVTITFSGMTTTSMQMTWSYLLTTSLTYTADVPGKSSNVYDYLLNDLLSGLSRTQPQPTTLTWWQTEPGNITMNLLDTSVEDPSPVTLQEVSN